jgi:hypothetical protein
MINLGCIHMKYAYGHCADMYCRNYIGKCPLHCTTSMRHTTATCNLERAKYLTGLSAETRELTDKIIGLDPALEDSILLLIDLVVRDMEENNDI